MLEFTSRRMQNLRLIACFNRWREQCERAAHNRLVLSRVLARMGLAAVAKAVNAWRALVLRNTELRQKVLLNTSRSDHTALRRVFGQWAAVVRELLVERRISALVAAHAQQLALKDREMALLSSAVQETAANMEARVCR